jgi:hypothetical protein
VALGRQLGAIKSVGISSADQPYWKQARSFGFGVLPQQGSKRARTTSVATLDCNACRGAPVCRQDLILQRHELRWLTTQQAGNYGHFALHREMPTSRANILFSGDFFKLRLRSIYVSANRAAPQTKRRQKVQWPEEKSSSAAAVQTACVYKLAGIDVTIEELINDVDQH